jgi:xanthine dehydrogenase accessory factor
MDFFARALAAVVADPGGGALATVVAASGSTPRHLGARMMITREGRLIGSVGGGRIEHEVVQRAAEVVATQTSAVVSHHLVRDLAMCCGGSMEVALAPAAACREALEAVVAAERDRRPVVLETPRAGGPWRTRALRPGEERLGRRPRVEGEHVVEGCGRSLRVVLFGAGHVGRAVGSLAATCGFDLIVCDDGDTGALDEPLPWAHHVVPSFDAAEVERELGGFGADDLLLIVTRDHAVDQRILESVLRRDDLGFLGMIGSRGKVGRFYKRLLARGLVTGPEDPAWQRLAAPIGLDLGAETPGEIAVAVVAQLVAVRRLGQLQPRAWQGAVVPASPSPEAPAALTSAVIALAERAGGSEGARPVGAGAGVEGAGRRVEGAKRADGG